ncbi:hypothetical protein LJR225_003337 [Phenylobacterium sp. LjRoot225]|uniref:hypothetical protein n=1 Tax=Phenylobacterium sp. LjRoot225 TaxID=3342285 RepID=UPI003ED086A0
MVWTYAGDALWIVALSIMFSASRQAWRRIPQDVKPPLMGVRLPRGLVVWALPGAAFLLSLWFVLQARTWSDDADLAFIWFGVRAVSAPLLALLHLRWLGEAMTALEREGQLKP